MDAVNDMTNSPVKTEVAQRAVPPLPPLFRIGKKMRHRISAVIGRSSKVGDTPTLDPALFPWMSELERRWPEIRAEVDELLAHEEGIPPLADISPDHRRIAPPGKWRSFFLWGYGYRLQEKCRRFPAPPPAGADN